MAVYNEEQTAVRAVKRLLEVDFPCETEIIVVDDGSTDGSLRALSAFDDLRVSICRHPVNQGKGAAIRTALTNATGDYAIPLDADLEYDPRDIRNLLKVVQSGEAEVVFGTRAFASHSAYSFWYVIGNKLITLFANVLFNSWISDLETCFKLLPTSLFRSLDIRSCRFGIEAEVTAKLLRRGYRPYEIPITYKARSREEGKKLSWRDGVEALWLMARIRVVGR